MADFTIKTAVWGGNRADSNDPEPVIASTVLKKIVIRHGHTIHSIEYTVEVNGVLKTYGPWGGTADQKSEITFESGEHLISINGTYYDAADPDDTIISSLAFKTNFHAHGPFGEAKGTPFSLSLVNAKIVGFHVRSYVHELHAIGVYLAPQITF